MNFVLIIVRYFLHHSYRYAQVIQPTLDDIQQALNKATQAVLDVTRSVAQWGQKRFKSMEISCAQDDGAPGHIKRTVRAIDSSKWLFKVLIPDESQLRYVTSERLCVCCRSCTISSISYEYQMRIFTRLALDNC